MGTIASARKPPEASMETRKMGFIIDSDTTYISRNTMVRRKEFMAVWTV